MTFSSQTAGSPSPGEPAFLVIGKLRRPHGVSGELLMEVFTDFPERIQPGSLVYTGEAQLPMRVRSRRFHQAGMLIAFEGYLDSESVQELRNCLVYVPKEDRPSLPEGDYYHHQILGLNVVDEAGAQLGKVTEILETGANDVLVIALEKGGVMLLPYIDSTVRAIDLPARKMVVRLLAGIQTESTQSHKG
jgi:16S rRNA processing protein RimM